MALAMIQIDTIEAGQRLRAISEAQVVALMDSIGDVGLLNPITVHPRSVIRSGTSVDGYGLIAGAHRLEAYNRLGLVEIPAQVVELSDLERQIAECDENLCGTKLTPSEKALFTRRRQQAYEALHPETKHGAIGRGRGKSSQVEDSIPADRFTLDTAKKTGVSEQSIQRDADRGKRVCSEALSLLINTPLDTGVYLDKVKAIDDAKEQVATVKRDLAMHQNRPKTSHSKSPSKIDSDVRVRAAKEVAEIIAEHVPCEWWDAVKANLYSAGAKNIADQFTNITGQSIMDRRYS